jgi:peptide/nickel transport system substrate-binding protein
MENRFGFKDFILFALVLAAIGATFISMWQFDRQYRYVLQLKSQNDSLTRDIQSLKEMIGSIPARQTIAIDPTKSSPETQPQTTSAPAVVQAGNTESNPFVRVVQARSMPNYSPGDWLIDNLGARVGRLTPLVNEDVYGSTVRARVLETLLTRDPETLQRKPLLAESFDMSSDGLTLTYKLRKGVTFSDGTPFTADDVIFSFDWIMNPVVDAARSRSYLTEQGVSWRKVNDHEVVFSMQKPYFEFLNITGDTPILSKAFYSKFTPEQYNEKTGLLFGTGPYRLGDPENWSPGTKIELLRNERYWANSIGGKPAFDRIIYLEVEEEAVESTMFGNRQLDIIATTPDQHDRMKEDAKLMEGTNALEYPSVLGGYTYIGWNQRKGDKPTRFADKRVRQAMTLLVDRERMAKDLWRGYATVAPGPFTRRGRQAAPDVEPWPFDPDRARALLKECGFADRDADGIIESDDGEPFSFEMMFPAKSDVSLKIALFLKDAFAAGGVLMELKPTDWPTMLEQLKFSNFDACTLGWSSSVETDLFQIFHSSQTADGGDNRTGFVSPKLDELIERARQTVREDDRMLVWQEAARVIHDEQPYTFLLDRMSLRMIDKRIQNIEKTRMGINLMVTEVMPIPWFTAAGQARYAE